MTPSDIPSIYRFVVVSSQSDWDDCTTKIPEKQPFMAHHDTLWERVLVTSTGLEPVFSP
jgi:hypothetical protein